MDFAETASNHGKIVIISALSGTFERKPFKDVLDLIPKCEKIKQLTAICKICQGVACFSLRTVSDSRTELIGGGDRNITFWGQEGWEEGALRGFGEPLSIEVDQFGDLYIADVGNHYRTDCKAVGLKLHQG